MNTRAKRLLLAGLTAGGLLAAAGCGTAAGATDETSPSPSPSLPTPTQTVAQRQVATGNVHAQLVIFGLHRTGSLATLDFGLVNKGDDPISANSLLSRDGMEDDVSGVYLVDTGNKKKYLPARREGECLCSTLLSHARLGVGKGQTQYLTAVYAAPPSSVHDVDVSFPHFGTVKNVPVQ